MVLVRATELACAVLCGLAQRELGLDAADERIKFVLGIALAFAGHLEFGVDELAADSHFKLALHALSLNGAARDGDPITKLSAEAIVEHARRLGQPRLRASALVSRLDGHLQLAQPWRRLLLALERLRALHRSAAKRRRRR